MWERSEMSTMDGEGLFVPKMHAVMHLMLFVLMFGAVDNARLGLFEQMHQKYVKQATRRTRQWENSYEDEVIHVADRIDADLSIQAEESGCGGAHASCLQARLQPPPTHQTAV